MKLSELREYQSKVADYRSLFKGLISVDGKIYPKSFLSTESACYKLLDELYQDMNQGFEPSPQDLRTLSDIDNYVFHLEHCSKWDKETCEVSYVERSTCIWIRVLENSEGEYLEAIRIIIYAFAAAGDFQEFRNYEFSDLLNPEQMAWVIINAHFFIEKLEPDSELWDIITETDLYKDFFHLL